MSKQYAARQNTLYCTAVEREEGLIELAHVWFPGSTCTVSSQKILEQDAQLAVNEYLSENHWLDESTILRSTERAVLLEALVLLTGNPYKTLGPALKRYGYKLQPLTKSKDTNAPHRIIPATTE